MRREWNCADNALRQHMSTKAAVGKESKWSHRQQALNLQCGNLYI